MKIKSIFAAGIAGLTMASFAPTAAHADTNPYLGDIMMVGFNFCPRGWAGAEGQLLPIASNQALFSLYGTSFGGDGRTTFALPDLRGRVAVHNGSGPGLTPRNLGARGGAETNTMTSATMPTHSHSMRAGTDVNVTDRSRTPAGNTVRGLYPGAGGTFFTTSAPTASDTFNSGTLANTGNSQSFNNFAPTLSIRYCVALQGVFPSRN